MHTDLQLNLINNLSSDNDSSISNDSSSSSCNAAVPSSSNSEPEISNLTETLNDLNFSSAQISSTVNQLYDTLVDTVALGIYFNACKAAQINSMLIDNSRRVYANEVSNTELSSKNKIRDNSSLDIFGNNLNRIRKLECLCPNCQRNLAASRLAPHLEKCMGMGRNSSRLASKRIALFIKNSNGTSSE